MTHSDIFSRHRINFKPKHVIKHMTVCNNFVLLGLQNNSLIRVNLRDPENHEGFKDYFISHLHTHQSALHTILSTYQGDNLYLAKSARKLRYLSKLKDNIITCLAWNEETTSNKALTGSILLGTSKGLVIETNISPEERPFFPTSWELYTKTIINLSKEKICSIEGITFHRIPNTNNRNVDDTYKYFVIITTAHRLYQYIHSISVPSTQSTSSHDTPYLYKIFTKYENIPEKFYELPGDLPHSFLTLNSNREDRFPTSLAWLCGAGIYLCSLDGTFSKRTDSILIDNSLLPYPRTIDLARKDTQCCGAILTQFHILLLYPDRLIAINVKTRETAFEDIIPVEYGTCKGICIDTGNTNPDIISSFWVFCASAVLRYRITDEGRNIWRYFLSNGDYESAHKYCIQGSNSDNPETKARLAEIDLAQANYTFDVLENYEEAATLYAKCTKILIDNERDNIKDGKITINEVGLKFYGQIDKISNDALMTEKLYNGLITYLTLMLKGGEMNSFQDRKQITILVLWICQLYLTLLTNFLQKSIDFPDKVNDIESELAAKLVSSVNIRHSSEKSEIKTTTKKFKSIIARFKEFLTIPIIQDCLLQHKDIIFKVIQSYGIDEAYLTFAEHCKDYDKIIEYYIAKNDYHTAIQFLSKQHDPTLYYKYSSDIITHSPSHLIASWKDCYLKRKVWLDPSRLFSSIILLLISLESRTDLNEDFIGPKTSNHFALNHNKKDNISNNVIVNSSTNKYVTMVIEYLEFCVTAQKRQEEINSYSLFDTLLSCTQQSNGDMGLNVKKNAYNFTTNGNNTRDQSNWSCISMLHHGTNGPSRSKIPDYLEKETGSFLTDSVKILSSKQPRNQKSSSYEEYSMNTTTNRAKTLLDQTFIDSPFFQNDGDILSTNNPCFVSREIHNFLISLYCQHQPDKLLNYFKSQGLDQREFMDQLDVFKDTLEAQMDRNKICYDPQFALRICHDYNNLRACVHLRIVMSQIETAVKLALQFDIELAKTTANQVGLGDPLRKKLWIVIAQHSIKSLPQTNEVNDKTLQNPSSLNYDALKMLCDTLIKQSEFCLEIEDLLPYFPDFHTIDCFKESILESLNHYNTHLKTLDQEIEAHGKTANTLHNEISFINNKPLSMELDEKCVSCQTDLLFTNNSNINLQNSFYVFPCTHAFHILCLIKEIKKLLPKDDCKIFEEAEKLCFSSTDASTRNPEIAKLINDNVNSLDTNLKFIKQLAQEKIEKYISDDCPFCGALAINAIDKPFIDPEKSEE